jgi:hypothetical protein
LPCRGRPGGSATSLIGQTGSELGTPPSSTSDDDGDYAVVSSSHADTEWIVINDSVEEADDHVDEPLE